MMKDDIQVGSIVVKTSPGSKGKPLKVVSRNETHAKVYYLSSIYYIEKAKWYPLSNLKLFLQTEIPEKQKENNMKNFVITVEDKTYNISSDELNLGDMVAVEIKVHPENQSSFNQIKLGRVTAQVIETPVFTSGITNLFKISMSPVKIDG